MGRLALLGAWLFALFIVCHPIFDYDLHWHLANGREMVQRGQIISEEIFSYTHFGDKFENHEWLAQIIFYLVWQTNTLAAIEDITALDTGESPDG